MWITTHLRYGVPQQAEHPSEQAAEQHERYLRANGYPEAVAFWSEIAAALDVEVAA